jgi:hypothetical protein
METDIFDEYVKLAIAKGWISEGKKETRNDLYRNKEKAHAETQKKEDAEKTIQLLYGVKPEKVSIKTEESFWEAAHPETAVAGRAYDGMNGVWENIHERQNIMAYIANKMPTGQLFGTRLVAIKEEKANPPQYAKEAKEASKNLMDSLVSSAMFLDNQDETELMALADSCIERFSNKMIKTSQIPWSTVGIVGAAVALLGGAAYYFMEGDTTGTNVLHNAELVLEALQPLSSESYAEIIGKSVQELIDAAKEANEEKDQIVKLISPQDAATFAIRKQEAMDIAQKLKNYTSKLDEVSKEIPKWVSAITLEHTNTNDVEKESDWYAKLEQIGKHIWWEPWQILVNRLYGSAGYVSEEHTGGLYGAIKNDRKNIAMAEQYAQGVQPEVQQHVENHVQNSGTSPVQPQSALPSLPDIFNLSPGQTK